MAVHDRVHVGPDAIDLGMDEAFLVNRPPAGIDLDRAEARFENGVLTLRVPKAAGESSAKRRIEIK